MSSEICYEYPLTKSMRQFLRFEQLVAQFQAGALRPLPADSYETLVTLCDIYQLTIHVDLKAEVLREIERLGKNLKLTGDDVGFNRLNEEVSTVNTIRGQLGGHLKNHHFFNLVRQRTSMPGGMNPFDLPISHYWLEQPHEERKHDLDNWIQPYAQLNQAIGEILRLTRATAVRETEIAEEGFFQKTFTGPQEVQLLQVYTSHEKLIYPEVSSGRQRVSIRFFQINDLADRASQTHSDVEFEFQYCI